MYFVNNLNILVFIPFNLQAYSTSLLIINLLFKFLVLAPPNDILTKTIGKYLYVILLTSKNRIINS